MRSRIAFALPGVLLLAFGAFRLLTYLETSELVTLAIWLAAAIVLHDGVIAPLTVGTGVLLTRVPARGRRYVQGALIAGALITVIALPLINRQGTQPEVKAILLRNYAGNYALLLGLVAAVALALYVRRVVTGDDERPADPATSDS